MTTTPLSLPLPTKSLILPLRTLLRSMVLGIIALTIIGMVGWGIPELGFNARLTLIVFGLAILGWVGTNINDTYIALAGAILLVLTKVGESGSLFAALGDSTIWLLLAAFMVATGISASGLSNRLMVLLAKRTTSVQHLFYLLTTFLLLTALLIPSTSGRASLAVPIFAALSLLLNNARLNRALGLLFPTIILLSAVASPIGAGAHLVMIDTLEQMGYASIGFIHWLLLGFPLAAVSAYLSCWVILRLFLTREERTRPLHIPATAFGVAATAGWTRREKVALALAVGLVILWATEPLHGLDNTTVALLGALAMTAPGIGIMAFKEAIKGVNWTLLLFMAASLELGESLVTSGAAEWLMGGIFTQLNANPTVSTLAVVSVVALISLLAHLLITSRTARATVLIPLVILLATSLGYDPVAFAFLSTAAAGFCLTLPVSAKPVAMFAQLDQRTYEPRDLLRLSSVLLPLHLVLFMAFSGVIWPVMGLDLARDPLKYAPPSPTWRDRQAPLQAPPLFAPYTADPRDPLQAGAGATVTVTATIAPSVTPHPTMTPLPSKTVPTATPLDNRGESSGASPSGGVPNPPASMIPEETIGIPTSADEDGTPSPMPTVDEDQAEAGEEPEGGTPPVAPQVPMPLPSEEEEDTEDDTSFPPPAEPEAPSSPPSDNEGDEEGDAPPPVEPEAPQSSPPSDNEGDDEGDATPPVESEVPQSSPPSDNEGDEEDDEGDEGD